jgi:hypothetical protein
MDDGNTVSALSESENAPHLKFLINLLNIAFSFAAR